MSAPTAALVVGAGPAGCSVALWLRNLAIPFDWVDRDGRIGGTLHRVGNPIRDWLGGPCADGADAARRLAAPLDAAGIAPIRAELSGVEPCPGGWTVRWGSPPESPDGSSVVASTWRAVLLATGTRPRRLDVPGASDAGGRGVEISVTRTRANYVGMTTLVVGGGDAALEGALLLAEVCPTVHLVHRSSTFIAQTRFVEAAGRHPAIRMHVGRRLAAVLRAPDGRVTAARLDDGTTLQTGGVFLRIGVEPNLPDGLAALAVDPAGYPITHRDGRTSLDGLWIVGDTASSDHQSIAWAEGTGARAATDLQAWLGLRGPISPARSRG